MKSEWRLCRLSEITDFKNGKSRPKDNGVFPVYGGNGILDYTNEYNYENSIIIGRVGAYCGSVFLSKTPCWVSDNAIAAVPKKNSDLIYLYYLLKSLKLNVRHIGTSQPLLTQEILNNIECAIPPLATQRRIAAILSSLDDKIELNNKINANLQQQAQALFKSWFVDFEPWGGVMPEGWREGTIAELGSVVGGGTPAKAHEEYYTDLGIPWITPKDLSLDKSTFIGRGQLDISEVGFRNSSATLMPRGTVLFSSRAPIGYIAIAKNEVTTNQGFKSIVPNENVGTAYVYFLLKHILPTIESMASGSTFKEVSGSIIKSVPALIPDSDTLLRFEKICTPLFNQQEILESENRRLVELRDTLLPKLMSGELDVSDIELSEVSDA